MITLLTVLATSMVVSAITLLVSYGLMCLMDVSVERAYTVGWAGLLSGAFVPLIITSAIILYPSLFFNASPHYASFEFSRILLMIGRSGTVLLPVLASMFVIGMLGQLVLWIKGIFEGRRLMFQAQPLANPDTHGRLALCMEKYPRCVYPVLFLSEAIRFPAIWCWGLHPAILLPKSMVESGELTEIEMEAVFLHELGHLRRHDHITIFLARTAGLVLFWNPLYWRMMMRLNTLSDTACDLFALARLAMTPHTYSEMLVRMAAHDRERTTYCYFAQKESMMKRIKVLLDESPHAQLSTRQTAFGTWLLFASTMLGTALLTLVITMPIFAVALVPSDQPSSNSSAMKAGSTDGIGKLVIFAEDNRISKSDSVKQFMADRLKLRLKQEKPTEEELKAAEQYLKHVQESYKMGHPQYDGIVMAKAKRELAEKKLALTGEQKYADEIVASWKNYSEMIQAQYKVGHVNGTSVNMFNSTCDYYQAKLLYAKTDEIPSPQDVIKLLEASDKLQLTMKNLFKAGVVPQDEVDTTLARCLEIQTIFMPLMNALCTNPKILEKNEIIRQTVNRRIADYPHTLNLSTPENTYASYMLLVACQSNAQKARDAFITLNDNEESPVFNRSVESFESNPQWIEICKKGRIDEKLIWRNSYAWVIGFLEGQEVRLTFDVRVMKKVGDRWLNLGNERYATVDEARRSFFKKVNRLKETEEKCARLYADSQIKITTINRPVSDWSVNKEKVENPETLYAVCNLLMASDDEKQIDRLKLLMNPSISEWKAIQRELVGMEPSFRKTLQNATIIKTIVHKDKALVIARLNGEGVRSPIDLRWCRYDRNKNCWLNQGNDRVESVQQAEKMFAEREY